MDKKAYRAALTEITTRLERDIEGQIENLSAALNRLSGLDEDFDNSDVSELGRYLQDTDLGGAEWELYDLLAEKEQAEEEE